MRVDKGQTIHLYVHEVVRILSTIKLVHSTRSHDVILCKQTKDRMRFWQSNHGEKWDLSGWWTDNTFLMRWQQNRWLAWWKKQFLWEGIALIQYGSHPMQAPRCKNQQYWAGSYTQIWSFFLRRKRCCSCHALRSAGWSKEQHWLLLACLNNVYWAYSYIYFYFIYSSLLSTLRRHVFLSKNWVSQRCIDGRMHWQQDSLKQFYHFLCTACAQTHDGMAQVNELFIKF